MSTIIDSPNSIPRRQDLIDRLANANRYTYAIVLVQIALCVAFASFINWQRIIDEPLITTVVAALILGPQCMQLLRSMAEKKVEISKLKQETRFGEFDKYSLSHLYSQTLQKLGLPDDRIPLYITADKSLNAMAAHYGLGTLFKRFNGLYLHRQVLHMLTPQEVQDTIGHELGHYYAYYYRLDRFRWVTYAMAALMAIACAQYFDMNGLFFYAALLLCPVLAFLLNNIASAKYIQSIEYLCDDFGAHTNGIEVAINALMKLGASAEMQTSIFFETLLAKHYNNLSAVEIMDSIMRATPYGHASQEEIQKSVERELKNRQNRGPSVGGFFNYVWNSDGEADVNAELDRMARLYKKLKDSPRLDWESLLNDPQRIDFRGQSLQNLISAIEANPDIPLFREVIDKNDSPTHPPTKNRILYLWYNRREIESSPALPSRF